MWDEWTVDCKLQGSGGEDLGRFLRERLQTHIAAVLSFRFFLSSKYSFRVTAVVGLIIHKGSLKPQSHPGGPWLFLTVRTF